MDLGTLGTRNLALLSRLVPSTKFVETERSRTQVRSLVKTALVANDLTGCEGRTTPRRRFGRVAVVASPPQVLSFLRSGIISVLNRNSVRNGISSDERERRILLLVHIRLGGKHEGLMVLELDTRPF
jgi:hypothetical protein